jgi:hypothetical protein
MTMTRTECVGYLVENGILYVGSRMDVNVVGGQDDTFVLVGAQT